MKLEIPIPFTKNTKLVLAASLRQLGLSISTKHAARVSKEGITSYGTTFLAFCLRRPEKPQPWVIEHVKTLAWHYKLQVFLMRMGIRCHNVVTNECMHDFSCCSWQSRDDKAMMGVLGALVSANAQNHGHLSDSGSDKTSGVYITHSSMGTCKICGKHHDLRMGVCFECKDLCSLEADEDDTGMYKVYEINNPNNWWLVCS